jgi:uncharacterized membrane protein
MIEWALIFARDVALAVWLGGLIVIDFIEAPAKFRAPEIDRNQAAAVGRQVFAAVNQMEVVVGAILLALLLLLNSLATARAVSSGATPRASVACAGLMWIVALAQNFWFRPRISELTRSLDLVNRSAEDRRYTALRRWHILYVTLDMFKIILGLLLVGLWTHSVSS